MSHCVLRFGCHVGRLGVLRRSQPAMDLWIGRIGLFACRFAPIMSVQKNMELKNKRARILALWKKEDEIMADVLAYNSQIEMDLFGETILPTCGPCWNSMRSGRRHSR